MTGAYKFFVPLTNVARLHIHFARKLQKVFSIGGRGKRKPAAHHNARRMSLSDLLITVPLFLAIPASRHPARVFVPDVQVLSPAATVTASSASCRPILARAGDLLTVAQFFQLFNVSGHSVRTRLTIASISLSAVVQKAIDEAIKVNSAPDRNTEVATDQAG